MFIFISIAASPALNLINENIQNWTAYTSYGSYTQTIPAGAVNMTRCIVSPNAAATGTCSTGRIQMEASTGIVVFPELPSIGTAEFHFAAGSTGRSVKLQILNGATWTDLITFAGITSAGATFSFDVNASEPATIRLASPSHALYVHDIIVTDYQNVEFPVVTTTAVSNITYDSVVSGGTVQNSGASAIIARGVCWGTTINPDLTNSFTTNGMGIGTFNSNITGLSPDTDYHVRAYATNGSGTSYGEDIPFRTANIGAPSLQSSNLILYPGSTSILTAWTPGKSSKRIVKINSTNNFTLPVNGVNYTPITVYAGTGEQVVYNGATQIIEGEAVNDVSITGLSPNTLYWLRVFDYNGDGASILYNTSSALNNPRSTTTLNSVLTGYYNGITGTGATLKTNLHNLLRTTHLTQFSYDALWTQLRYTDEDSTNTNNIIQIYTGWSIPKSYSGSGTSQWNREHTWSKSHGNFGDSPIAGTDLHHLRPCDVTVNSAKGNKDFDNGGTPYTDASPYTGYSGVTGCNTDTDSWEPRSVEKGDIARMILYMAIRYEGTDTSYNLEMQDTTPTTGPFYGKLSTLLQWHVQDPPDSWERRRNNRIHERQGNRNPFVDHPEFVNMLWAPTTTAATITDSVSFIANWTAAVNAQSYVLDVSTSSQFNSFVPGYQNLNVGNTNSRTVTVPASNMLYYYRLRSFFTAGYSMNSNITSVSLSGQSVNVTSFTADEESPGVVTLYWTQQGEANLAGYYLLRGLNSNLNQAVMISNLMTEGVSEPPYIYYTYNDNTTTQGTNNYYWLKAAFLNGSFHYFGPLNILTTANPEDDYIPQSGQVSISSIYPNPFRTSVSVNLAVSKAEPLAVKVFNLKGQYVNTVFEGFKSAGQHTLSWSGKDIYGRQSSPGIYFIRLESGSSVKQQKVLLF